MLILASASPTRKALLAGAGLTFATRPAAIDERRIEQEALGKGPGPDGVATLLAEAKAVAISAAAPDDLVIGADQVLTLEGALLHKPADRAAAARQLDRLRGRSHELIAGIALARGGELLWSHQESARLTMRDFSDAERDAVLDLEGDQVLGSVGAYRLEGPSIRLFADISGDYFTILGLPLLALLAALRRLAPEFFAP